MLLTTMVIAGSAYAGHRLWRWSRKGFATVEPHDAAAAGQPAAEQGQPADASADADTATDPETQRIYRDLALSGTGTACVVAAPALPALALPGAALLCVSMVPWVSSAWHGLRRGRLGPATIDLAAAGVVIAGGLWSLAGVTIVVVHGSRLLNRWTERRSQADLVALFRAERSTARVLRDGAEVVLPASQIEVGDRVRVDAGAMIPVDGRVVTGFGLLDEQALTGEAALVERGPGAAVLATTFLVEGRLEVEASRSGQDTIADGVLGLLRDIEASKQREASHAEQVIERWAPATIGAAALALPLAGPAGSAAVLFSGIGYPLRYAGPLATLTAMRRGARLDTLIRDGRALERLADIDTFVFDKTGTLTVGQPTVRAVVSAPDIDPRTLLAWVAACEASQSHPIASAIRAAAEREGVSGDVAAGPARVVRGLGVEMRIATGRVRVGSRRFMASVDIDVPEREDDETDGSVSRVHVALDDRWVGRVDLDVPLRPGAREAVRALQAAGCRVHILSGDRRGAVASAASALGVDAWEAEVLPADKADSVERLEAEGRRVCFVGDGINDAVALQVAHVGVSLVGASTIAEQGADLVLLNGDLGRLVELLALARSLGRNVRRSTRLSMATGLTAIAGVFGLGMGPRGVVALYNAGLAGALGNAYLSWGASPADGSTPSLDPDVPPVEFGRISEPEGG